MDKNVKLISCEELNQVERLEDLKIDDNIPIKTVQGNFIKMNFCFNEILFELGVSLYSNMIFIIITNNAKIGNLWFAEIEQEIEESIIEEEAETSFELKCILGERKNEFYEIVSNMIIRKLIRLFTNKGSRLKNVMISMAFRSNDIDNSDFSKDVLELNNPTKQFIELINKKLEIIF